MFGYIITIAGSMGPFTAKNELLTPNFTACSKFVLTGNNMLPMSATATATEFSNVLYNATEVVFSN